MSRATIAIARIAVAVSVTVLVALGVTYYLTYEPSAEIGISWHIGMTTDARRAHERRFGLVNRRVEQGRMRYDLVDLRPENVRALLAEPDVEDTDGIDRITEDLPIDYRYGERWVWIGTRVPVLRGRGVIPGILVTCALAIAAGIGLLARSQGKTAA